MKSKPLVGMWKDSRYLNSVFKSKFKRVQLFSYYYGFKQNLWGFMFQLYQKPSFLSRSITLVKIQIWAISYSIYSQILPLLTWFCIQFFIKFSLRKRINQISYLVHDRFDGAAVQDALHLLAVEIGQADGADQPQFDALLHSLPGLGVVHHDALVLVLLVFGEDITPFLQILGPPRFFNKKVIF